MNYIEDYLFNNQKISQKILSFLLLPFTAIYCIVVYLKKLKPKKDFDIPIISIGNIIIGGSGKTPFTIALCGEFKERKKAVILRGYKRKSTGLFVVSNEGEILVDVDISGDEAMEIALSTNATVIVSEDREIAIVKAKELGCEFVILDDGFNKPFEKFDILIKKEIKNSFCIPSGGYRDFKSSYKEANLVLEENRDFMREVKVPKLKDFVLVSAISNPQRLLNFVKTDKYKFFLDHHNFTKEDIEKIKKEFNTTILTTKKDYVKLQKFDLDIKVIELKFKINSEVTQKIEQYLIKYVQKKQGIK
jgi:tetraacyldisaccharide 4'-kinase